MVASIAPLVVIVGPTASGKSELAMQIAKKYKGELICADSRTIYKGLDIGTAKPSVQDQKNVPHHLIDIVEPNQDFTVAHFKLLANRAIADIWRRGKIPILVGGSGLYIDSVLFDYHFAQPANTQLRKKLADLSIKELQKMCSDRHIALPTNHLNKRYLIRAIEAGGILQQPHKLRSKTIVVGVTMDKAELSARVTSRVQKMLSEGVVQEAKQLGQKYGWNNEAMKSNVYRICYKFISGEVDLKEAEALAIQSDLRLAKKQRTWFKRNPHIIWGDNPSLKSAIEDFFCRQSK